MLSYVSGPSTEPLIGQTIGDNLDETARTYADSLALVSRHQQIRWTYREFLAAVDEAARAFIDLGVARGDRVGIWAPNCAEWAVTQYATAKIGAILVNINPAYRTHELQYALDQSGVSVLVSDEAFKSSRYLEMIEQVRPDVPALRRVIALAGNADETWTEFLERSVRVPPERLAARQADLQFDDPINIQYTSGTTGRPKGATLTHHNILNNGHDTTGLQNIAAGDRICIPVPLYHCFGMVIGNLGCTTRGATMVYPSPSFEPAATLEAVAAERCVSVYGVPTMFIAMLEDPSFAEHDLSSLRTGVMAGAPCPIEVMKRCINDMHMAEVEIAFGMTEMSPVSFQSRVDDSIERRVATVGRVMPHVECKVVDPETGHVVPTGVAGEICTRGYSVMRGYWQNPEATAEAIDAAGWMHTGDLGVLDDDGYLVISGRIKDMIIRGGENIYPREIEEFLFTHPAIADAQVIGVPDRRLGEEICAWVQLREGETLTLEDLKEYSKDRIAHFKVPRYLYIADEFPMTVTGKAQKFKMRDLSIERFKLHG